jgi:hypothetical protein
MPEKEGMKEETINEKQVVNEFKMYYLSLLY